MVDEQPLDSGSDAPPPPPPPPPPPSSPPSGTPPPPPGDAPPGYGQPSYGQPSYGQPSYGQPSYGQPSYGQQLPPPPPGYTPPGYGTPGYGYAVRTEGTAIAAFVVALAGLFICGLITGIVALVLANNAQQKIRASNGMLTGSGFVTAARVIAIISIVLSLLGIVLVLAS